MGLKRNDWIDAAYRMLFRKGVDGVRVEVLARWLGVTTGSFYHHFENREALLETMICNWEEETEQLFGGMPDGLSGLDRIKLLLQRMADINRGIPDAAFFAWALRDTAVAKRVAAAEQKRLDFLIEATMDRGIGRAQAERTATFLYLAHCGWVMREGVAEKTAPRFDVFTKWAIDLFEEATEPR